MKRQRQITQLAVVAIVIFVAIYFLITDEMLKGCFFLAGAIPTYFLCAFYTKLLYRFSLKKRIATTYRQSTPRTVTLHIHEDEIEYHERMHVKKEKLSNLKEVVNISEYLYFKLSETSYLIIPKNQLNDSDYVEKKLEDMANNNKVPFISKPKWKWQ